MQKKIKKAAVLLTLFVLAFSFGAINPQAIEDIQVTQSQQESVESQEEALESQPETSESQEESVESQPETSNSRPEPSATQQNALNSPQAPPSETTEPLAQQESVAEAYAAAVIPVSTEADVLDALALNSNPITLVLMQDIELSATLALPADKKVSLQTPNNQDVFTIYPSTHLAILLSVPSGAELSIDGPIVIDGKQTSYSYAEALIHCSGTLYLNHENSAIQNFRSSTARSGTVLVNGSGARFYMQNGSIQNNGVSNQYAGAGVLVYNGAYFEMNGGSIQNNLCEDASSSGGVMLYAYQNNVQPADAFTSSFVMNAGQIDNNVSQFGGGVCMRGASPIFNDFYSKTFFEMNGGKITNNTATGYTVGSNFRNGGGGGVYLSLNSVFIMNDGEISGNTVQGMGGGIATFDEFVSYFGKVLYTDPTVPSFYQKWPELFPASFTMNGGEIINNQALSSSGILGDGGCGGGVYSASSHVYLNAGLIDNNYAERQGGGVYVGSVPYSVSLNDLLLTDNTADLLGGGIWLCPTGELVFHIYRGAAVFGNRTTAIAGAGDDIAIVRNDAEIADIQLADRMLGGGLTNWNLDGGVDDSPLGNPTSAPRYDPEDPIPMENISGTDIPSLALKSTPSDAAMALAKSGAQLIISNNSSLRGGGIGTNGSIILGDAEQPSIEVTLRKVWQNIPTGVQLPTSVTVYLQISGYTLDMVTLSAENNWSATLSGLPADAVVNVVEVAVSNFTTSYDWREENNGRTLHVSVINTYQSSSATGELTIRKVVSGRGDQTRQFNFRVQLLDDEGQELSGEYTYTGSRQGGTSSNGTFGLAHDEYITIAGLPEGVSYRVVEVDANQDGYRVRMENDTGIIQEGGEAIALFTNHLSSRSAITTSRPTPTSHPTPGPSSRTGDTASPLLWVTCLVLSSLGLLYFVQKKKNYPR